MSHCVFLMLHQRDFRIHSLKLDMTAIVLSRTDTIETLIVYLTKGIPAVHIPENP